MGETNGPGDAAVRVSKHKSRRLSRRVNCAHDDTKARHDKRRALLRRLCVSEIRRASTTCCAAAGKLPGGPGGALSAPKEDHAMEVAAFVLIGSVVLWFIEEATDRHL